MGISRREFLERMGGAGGYSAAFLGLQGLGILPARALAPEPIPAAPDAGRGTHVVILGAGIAGMVAAYELRALGYQCTILEALDRPGGRNYTVRTGDTVTFTDGSTQRCDWQPGHYQNFGPGRLPSIHQTILGYCRTLGVPLEVEINSTRSAHLEASGANNAKPVTQRRLINDSRGHVSELLAKCVAAGNLDADLSPEDHTRMLDFLRAYGPLDDAGKYIGSDRAGYTTQPGAGEDVGVLNQPLTLDTLLNRTFWNGMLFEEQFDMQATMFQPVGGMDRIAFAFAKSLGPIIRFNSPVTELAKTSSGVRVTYLEKGHPRTLDASFCICTLTLNQVRKLKTDLSPAYQSVVNTSTYANAYKVAWESRRFWEQDDNIYGGLEFLNDVCSTIWLPSAGLLSDRGVLVSGYGFTSPMDFDESSLAEKFATSRRSIEKLHPGHGHELEKPMYVGWARIPWAEGAWIESYGDQAPPPDAAPTASTSEVVSPHSPRAQTSKEAIVSDGYTTLLEPDGPIYFAGDGISHINAWQEGAALSARRVVAQIAKRSTAQHA